MTDSAQVPKAEKLRCSNWEAEPEFCGRDCGIDVPAEAKKDWSSYVFEAGWYVFMHGVGGHRHIILACCWECLEHWWDRQYQAQEKRRGS